MSVSKKGRRAGKSSHSTDANAIGYKRPPTDTRFTKGKSGNAGGRPKGRRNVANLTKELLNRPVRVRSGDETLEMRAIEAIFRVLANKAAQGNSRATSLVNKLLELAGLTDEITEEERQRRGVRLPRAYSREEFDLLKAPARERDRQRYLAMAESDEAPFEPSDDVVSSADIVPPAITAGDKLANQGKFDEALTEYRSQLALCKTELGTDSGNKTAQYNFRRAVARIGLLANVLLLAGEFAQALKIADEAIAESVSGFWIVPEEPFYPSSTNTGWINLIRAHTLMFLGYVDEARKHYLGFQTNKRDAYTSWEYVTLRDFVQMRRTGYWHPLMGEIEIQLADVGWVRDTTEDIPSGVDRDLDHAADVKLGDTLADQGKLDEAVELYRRILSECKVDLAKDRSDRRAQAQVSLAASRIGRLAWQFLLVGKFLEALDCAEEALGYDPNSTSLNLNRAHALMLLRRRNEARPIYFDYHGKIMSHARNGQDAIKEDFEKLRRAGRPHQLMDEVERRFSTARWDEKLDGTAEDGGASSAPRISGAYGRSVEGVPRSPAPPPAARPNASLENPILPLSEREDIESGHKLLLEGRFDEALVVYQRRINRCDQILANGVQNMQARDDRHLAVNKISDIALGYILVGLNEKALAAVDYALSVFPLSSFANVRRAHALMFLGKTHEAHDLYLQYHKQKMTPEQTGEEVILQDFDLMRKYERVHALMDEIALLSISPKTEFRYRTLIR